MVSVLWWWIVKHMHPCKSCPHVYSAAFLNDHCAGAEGSPHSRRNPALLQVLQIHATAKQQRDTWTHSHKIAVHKCCHCNPGTFPLSMGILCPLQSLLVSNGVPDAEGTILNDIKEDNGDPTYQARLWHPRFILQCQDFLCPIRVQEWQV